MSRQEKGLILTTPGCSHTINMLLVVTSRLWKLCYVYYLHHVAHMKAKTRGELGILTLLTIFLILCQIQVQSVPFFPQKIK